MKVCLLQTDIAWNNPLKNREDAGRLMDTAAGADVYILPEMFSTGFATEPEGMAEGDGASLRWMREMAAEHDAAIVGSIATDCGGGDFRNRLYFVTPDGKVAHYDKRHLFTYSGEHLQYACGTERTIVEFRGVRFLLCVCYDLRFPVWSRNVPGEEEEYDCAVYVANWPTSRREAWETLLRARAIENQCYVCGVNRVGSDMACEYWGGTQVIDPYGKVVAECREGAEDAALAYMDMERLVRFRKKFPVLKDADAFTMHIRGK